LCSNYILGIGFHILLNYVLNNQVSFEPMIESVTSKADDPLHRNPATEISNKYQSLSRQAHEFYAKQKEVMNITQSFIDAGNLK